jgi:hypothetical protein
MKTISISDACKSYALSRSTLYRLIAREGLEVENVDGKSYINVSDLARLGYVTSASALAQLKDDTADDTAVSCDTATSLDDTAQLTVDTAYDTADVAYDTAQLTVEKVRKDYPWTLQGCLKTDHIEDLELQHSVRMLHGGYMDPQHGWLSSCGGTQALAEGPDERGPLAATQAIARAQWILYQSKERRLAAPLVKLKVGKLA